MSRFILNILRVTSLFLLILVLLARISSEIVFKRGFENYSTESITLAMRQNTSYDLVFMGTSHGRTFSRDKNHIMVERILGRKIMNLSQGNGECGLGEQEFYLKYFYMSGNSADLVVFVLSPSLLFCRYLDVSSGTFKGEMFEYRFFFEYLFDHEASNKHQRLLYYVQNKFRLGWISQRPTSRDRDSRILACVDSSKVAELFRIAYAGETEEVFDYHCSVVENTVRLAFDHGSKVLFFIPPALFGKWKDHDKVLKFLDDLRIKHGIQYYDFSESVKDIGYYSDHHHLNTEGVRYFTEQFLKEILRNGSGGCHDAGSGAVLQHPSPRSRK